MENTLRENVEEVKILMTENINKVTRNIDDLENLQSKSEDLRDSSKSFNKQSQHLKRTMCFQDIKITVICSALLLMIIGIIILSIWLGTK